MFCQFLMLIRWNFFVILLTESLCSFSFKFAFIWFRVEFLSYFKVFFGLLYLICLFCFFSVWFIFLCQVEKFFVLHCHFSTSYQSLFLLMLVFLCYFALQHVSHLIFFSCKMFVIHFIIIADGFFQFVLSLPKFFPLSHQITGIWYFSFVYSHLCHKQINLSFCFILWFLK